MLYDKKLPSLKEKLRANALAEEEKGKTAMLGKASKKVAKTTKVEKKSKKSKSKK